MKPMKNERELAGMIMDSDLPKRLEAENAKLRLALQTWVDQGYIGDVSLPIPSNLGYEK